MRTWEVGIWRQDAAAGGDNKSEGCK